MFPRIEYLHWIEGRPDAATHDLGSSDLRGAGPPQTGVVPERLDGLPDPDSGTDLSSQVADVYGVDEDRVVLTAGATMANVVAVGAAITLATGEGSDGDGHPPRVLVEKPGYEPLVATPRALGATVDRFRRPDEEDYRLDPERIGGATVERTALVTITNRHNPSGWLADRETLTAAAAQSRDAGARLLVDEVYAPFCADPVDGGDAFGGPTAADVEGAVVTGSLTKFHGLGGLRVGWLVADPEFAERARQVAAHVPSLAAPSAALGRRALSNRESLTAEARELLRENHEILRSFVDRRDDLSGPVFDGSTYAFLEHESADGDLVAEAARERDLLVVPGRFFEAPERFRVSLGRDPGTVESALDVLGETLDEL